VLLASRGKGKEGRSGWRILVDVSAINLSTAEKPYVEDMTATDVVGKMEMEIKASYRDLTKGFLTAFIGHGDLDPYTVSAVC
jgi:hypothetical protein